METTPFSGPTSTALLDLSVAGSVPLARGGSGVNRVNSVSSRPPVPCFLELVNRLYSI